MNVKELRPDGGRFYGFHLVSYLPAAGSMSAAGSVPRGGVCVGGDGLPPSLLNSQHVPSLSRVGWRRQKTPPSPLFPSQEFWCRIQMAIIGQSRNRPTNQLKSHSAGPQQEGCPLHSLIIITTHQLRGPCAVSLVVCSIYVPRLCSSHSDLSPFQSDIQRQD